MGRTIVLAFLLAVALGAGAAQEPPGGGALRLADDRGEPLGAPVEACFVRDLGTDCVEVPAGSGEVPAESGGVAWRAFDLLRVEGPGHGPVTVRRSEIPAGEDGIRRLTVPRKATLRVRRPAVGRSGGTLSVALHPVADLDPTRPAHRINLPAGAPGEAFVEVGVPAGAWIVALESRGAAPDLHRLDAAPGGSAAVAYLARTGWSLVVRTVRSAEGAEAGTSGPPVPSARVELSVGRNRLRPPGDEAPSPPPLRSTETDDAGLALFTGIEEPVVDLDVSHPDLVPAAVPGVAGVAGGFEVHDQVLERGGVLEATVRLDGEPAAGWRCVILDEASERMPRRLPPGEPLGTPEAGSAETGAEGRCRVERLASGIFVLRAEAPEEGGGAAERTVRIVEGETTREDLDLSPIEVSGTVTRAGRGVPGHRVEISWIDQRPGHSVGEPVTAATTDEEGEYSATLWEPGKHFVSLLDAKTGRPAESRFVDVGAGGETIDFRLAAEDLEGMVVDVEGEPVPEMSIQFAWKHADGASHKSLRTGADGTFSVALPDAAGTVELVARAMDGRRSETVVLVYEEGTVHPPVVLTLVEPEGVSGTLTTAGGTPAHPGVVVSFPAEGAPGADRAIAFARVAEDGSFRVESGSGSAVVLWATGSGCPLVRAVAPVPAAAPVTLTCPASSGTLRLRFRDPQGAPVAGRQAALYVDGQPIPPQALGTHVGMLGISFESDRAGELTFPGLPPGDYQVETFGGGALGTQVAAGAVTELEVVLEESR